MTKKHEADVGQFWTHWCCTFMDPTYPGIKGHFIQETICCELQNRSLCKFNFKLLPTETILYIPPMILEELQKKYSDNFYTPSTGLRLLWWIYKITGAKISKSRLFGFDCFGKGVSAKNVANRTVDVVLSRKYYNQGQPSPRHRPQKERAIYNEITT